jgi:hypothetical protein
MSLRMTTLATFLSHGDSNIYIRVSQPVFRTIRLTVPQDRGINKNFHTAQNKIPNISLNIAGNFVRQLAILQ